MDLAQVNINVKVLHRSEKKAFHLCLILHKNSHRARSLRPQYCIGFVKICVKSFALLPHTKRLTQAIAWFQCKPLKKQDYKTTLLNTPQIFSKGIFHIRLSCRRKNKARPSRQVGALPHP